MKYIGDFKKLKKYGFKLGQETVEVPFNTYGRKTKKIDNIIKYNGNLDNLIAVAIIDKKGNLSVNFQTSNSPRSFSYSDKELLKIYFADLIKDNLIKEMI